MSAEEEAYNNLPVQGRDLSGPLRPNPRLSPSILFPD